MGRGGGERKRGRRRKRVASRVRNERNARGFVRRTNDARTSAQNDTKETDGRTKKTEGGGIFFKTNRSFGHGSSPFFRFFSTTSHDSSIIYRWDLTKEKEENEIEMFEKVSECGS